jgi:hypothetical protein
MSKFLERISEIIGWIGIAISPTLIGILSGIFIYYSNPGRERLILSISVGTVGLIIGIIWATKVYKSKNGTVWFLSRISATPELDKSEEESEDS